MKGQRKAKEKNNASLPTMFMCERCGLPLTVADYHFGTLHGKCAQIIRAEQSAQKTEERRQAQMKALLEKWNADEGVIILSEGTEFVNSNAFSVRVTARKGEKDVHLEITDAEGNIYGKGTEIYFIIYNRKKHYGSQENNAENNQDGRDGQAGSEA